MGRKGKKGGKGGGEGGPNEDGQPETIASQSGRPPGSSSSQQQQQQPPPSRPAASSGAPENPSGQDTQQIPSLEKSATLPQKEKKTGAKEKVPEAQVPTKQQPGPTEKLGETKKKKGENLEKKTPVSTESQSCSAAATSVQKSQEVFPAKETSKEPSEKVEGSKRKKGKGKGAARPSDSQASTSGVSTVEKAGESDTKKVESKGPKEVPKGVSPAQKGGKGGETKKVESKDRKDAPKVQDVSAEMKKMKIETPKYSIPKYKQQKTHNPKNYQKQIKIEVNYLPITFKDWNLKIFHYDVSFNPDRPKALFVDALNAFRSRHYPSRSPAFDRKKNLYAGGSPLPFGDTIRDTVQVVDNDDGGRQKEFDITIKLVNRDLQFTELLNYIKTGSSQTVPQDVVQATDIALRAGLYNNFIPCGRSFFSGPENVSLGGGLELYSGFFQSAIMGSGGAFLNVDVANKAFPESKHLLDYLHETLGVQDFRQGLDEYIKRDFQKFIKGLKVVYAPQGERRTYKVNGLGLDALSYRFPVEGRGEMSVAEYFSREKHINLRFPKLPLLHVGPPQRNTMIPIEFCTIQYGQIVLRKLDERQTSNMVRAAATSTDRRKMRIMDNINNANYRGSDILSREFKIGIDTNFAQVDSYVFKPPSIAYRDQKMVNVNNGVWRMDGYQFKNSGNGLQSWAILIKDGRTYANDVRKSLVQLFMRCGQQMGLPVNEPVAILEATRGPQEQSEEGILNNLKQFKKNHPSLQIVVVIMPGGGPGSKDAYSNIKRASELKCGVLTQCLKQITVARKMNPMTAQNILLKMNAKINGINHELGGPMKPPIFQQPVMFVGADVTHPAPGDENVPSIAAVAASFDRSGFKYKMMYHLQGSRREMIDGLEEIMIEQLKHFEKVNRGFLPVRIMYYRDGVSEGQFSQVLDIELDALRRACVKMKSDYRPAITFLVVQKRHHTRFFPRKQDGDGSKNNNVLAGTVVDTTITHPTELDFYLVSHQSIQGTARPTKYHVLWDDNNFNSEDLEILTYYLCYLFSRCNRSVSYPAPTYYAHLGAFRARAYWDGQRIDMNNLRAEQLRNGTIVPGITDNTPMFFV